MQTGIGADALDCLLNVGGRHIEIETKKFGGRLTPRQETLRDECVAAGGLFFLISDEAELDNCMMTLKLLDDSYHEKGHARPIP